MVSVNFSIFQIYSSDWKISYIYNVLITCLAGLRYHDLLFLPKEKHITSEVELFEKLYVNL